MKPGRYSRLIRAWLLTAAVDGVFSSALNVFAYHSTVAQLWQRVASTLIGPQALSGGTASVIIGLVMHISVALAWSVVFFVVAERWERLRQTISTPKGVLAVAVVYGPLIWMVMSLIVIPILTKRAPSITLRWWVQFFGHIPFVALPIVAMIATPSPKALRSE
jgi:hypothetical protein